MPNANGTRSKHPCRFRSSRALVLGFLLGDDGLGCASLRRAEIARYADSAASALRTNFVAACNVTDGGSPNSLRYAAANRPSSENPYCLAIASTLTAPSARRSATPHKVQPAHRIAALRPHFSHSTLARRVCRRGHQR